MTKHSKCAICNYGKSKGVLYEYPTILQSMGIMYNKYAHSKCILKIQQQALNFRSRIAGK